MDIWHLPGPAAFIRRVEHALRSGASVVVRFPGEAPTGFGEHVRSRLHGSWRCTILRPEPGDRPFESLQRRFAPQLPLDWRPTLLDLCEHTEFQGRLVWLDGPDLMNEEDWREWSAFLEDYGRACRSVPEFERTLFVMVLRGTPPVDAPSEDVTLQRCDWRGFVGEMDLLWLAYEQLCQRETQAAMLALLATTVARVAVWDIRLVERLLHEKCGVILDPLDFLRSIADEKGWTSDTTACWELGTDSGNGTAHAALVALDDPPRELERRLWSAQASTLLPVIDGWRRDFVVEHRNLLEGYLRDEGDSADPLDLDVGRLVGMVQRPGFDPEVRRTVRRMLNWRNDIAHLKPVPGREARTLAER